MTLTNDQVSKDQVSLMDTDEMVMVFLAVTASAVVATAAAVVATFAALIAITARLSGISEPS